MDFFAAVRSLTSSAQEALLQTVTKPADEEPPCGIASETSRQSDSPPLLVPHRPRERYFSSGLVPSDAVLSVASCDASSCPDRQVGDTLHSGAQLTMGSSEHRACGRISFGGSGTMDAAGPVHGKGMGASMCSTGVTSTAGSPAAPSSPSGSFFSDAASAGPASLGSLVASFAAAAAQSLMETIEQSSQQLFRPPGTSRTT